MRFSLDVHTLHCGRKNAHKIRSLTNVRAHAAPAEVQADLSSLNSVHVEFKFYISVYFCLSHSNNVLLLLGMNFNCHKKCIFEEAVLDLCPLFYR